MKIAILGKGTSAIITALVCINYGYDVEIYYDPDKPHLNVGESTTPHIANLIKNTLDISIGDLLDENVVSLKNGVEFDGWGIGNTFNHYFNNNAIALHFESGIFNPFIHKILETNGIKYHPFKVDGYDIDLNRQKVFINGNEYDHLIFCSGWSDTDEYKTPIFQTVNSALLHSKEVCDARPYTHHLATIDGWQFGLTFPERNLIKHGYLFNNKITSVEKAKKNIEDVDAKYISWEPKYCKKMIQNRFVSYNGNRLMFFEPLQALSLYYYIEFSNYICEFVENPTHENYVKNNQIYHRDINNLQTGLFWHYSYGSKYDSSFWNDVKRRANNFLNYNYSTNSEYYEDALFYNKKFSAQQYFNIGCFNYGDYIQVHQGMTGKKIEFKDAYLNFY